MTGKKRSCCGCGTCAGICPREAIKMKVNERGFYTPSIDYKNCDQCGLCNTVCPENDAKLSGFIFGDQNDILLGSHIDCYIGYCTDENLRFESSSGGMISQLLIFALEKGIIDGALVTRMKKNQPLEPEPFIARTKEEVFSAIGSKYCPVPTNILLKEILKKDGKFAVVGLPCHIRAIRKAEMMNPKLREKIVLHFGLFCSGVKSFFGTEYILKRMAIKKENIKSIKYRGKGWPGYMQIELRGGKRVHLSFFDSIYYGGAFGMLFKNIACIFCKDCTAELSDISFGDAWGIEKNDTKGTSLIIARTKTGIELLRKASFEGKVRINKIEGGAVLLSQPMIISKKHPTYCDSIKEIIQRILYYFSTHPQRVVRETFVFSFTVCLYFLAKMQIKKKRL